MRLEETASNFLLSAIWRVAFRPGYSPQAMRRHFELTSGASAEALRRKFPNARFQTMELGGVPAESIQTVAEAERVILYLHGGGYFMGSIHSYRRNAMRIAHRCRARVYVLEYRLAPEHPFPAALEDAKAAYLALSDRLPRFLMGDSAGGGLTLSTLVALRDEGHALPDGAVLISPFTDLAGTGGSLYTNARRDGCIGKRHLDAWSRWYYGDHDSKHPLISPVYADLKGLPPLLILVGSRETLLDDAVRVGERAKAAGVQVTLLIEENMRHDWCLALPWLARSKKSLGDICDFVGMLPRHAF